MSINISKTTQDVCHVSIKPISDYSVATGDDVGDTVRNTTFEIVVEHSFSFNSLPVADSHVSKHTPLQYKKHKTFLSYMPNPYGHLNHLLVSMNSQGIGGPLTEQEIRILQQCAVEYPSGLDLDTIEALVQDSSKNIQQLLNQEPANMSPEERMATNVVLARSSDKENLKDSLYFIMEDVINSGAKIFRGNDEYFRFEPCIELIFELDYKQLSKIAEYLHEFEQSDYSTVSEQYRHELADHHRNTRSMDDSGEVTAELLEMYKSIAGLYETTFPNLLALKRILDDEEASNEVLQSKSLSSVCRELLNTKEELNSAYFDLIVNKYDTNLRNGLSHGDIINDTVNEEVRIASRDVSYDYTEIRAISEQNLTNAIFLTGFYQDLIKWRRCTYQAEDITRDRLKI